MKTREEKITDLTAKLEEIRAELEKEKELADKEKKEDAEKNIAALKSNVEDYENEMAAVTDTYRQKLADLKEDYETEFNKIKESRDKCLDELRNLEGTVRCSYDSKKIVNGKVVDEKHLTDEKEIEKELENFSFSDFVRRWLA